MSRADESRLEFAIGARHKEGQPYHFTPQTQDARIRGIFGLAEDAPLPRVTDETLATYYDYLSANLTIPFEGLYCQNSGKMRQLIHYVRVVELYDPRQNGHRNIHGLLCKAQDVKSILELPLYELGVRDDNPNCQLIDDYAYWLVNYR